MCDGIQPFVDRIDSFRQHHRVTRTLIEHSLALREDFTMIPFYASDAYYRGILDLVYLYDDNNMAIIDHKSGEGRIDIDIQDQLRGYAVLARQNFSSLRRFHLGVHWVADQKVDWTEPLTSSECTQIFRPLVANNIEAAALAIAEGPRTEPGTWCEGCSYRSICPEGQRMRFEPVLPHPESDDDREPEPEGTSPSPSPLVDLGER